MAARVQYFDLPLGGDGLRWSRHLCSGIPSFPVICALGALARRWSQYSNEVPTVCMKAEAKQGANPNFHSPKNVS